MKSNRLFSKVSIPRLVLALGGLGLIAAALLPGRTSSGQQDVATPQATPEVRSLIDDWTMHHLVFPDTSDVKVLGRLQHDPRYWIQRLARQAAIGIAFNNGGTGFPASGLLASLFPALLASPAQDIVRRGRLPGRFPGGAPPSPTGSCRGPNCPVVDWGLSLGLTSGAALTADTYPAKFTFDVNATPDCAADYVTMPVNVAGANGAFATGAGTVTGKGTAGQTVTVGGQTLTASGSLASGTGTFTATAITGTPTATVTNGGNSIVLTASAPTDASNTGSFSSLLAPTSFATFTNANSITVTNNNPVHTLTLKTDATAAHETGSFSSPPFTSTSLTITHSSPSNLLT
ncbi:MAG: hypothetical protein DMG22_22440, partial [Acidobacteria bacterium]